MRNEPVDERVWRRFLEVFGKGGGPAPPVSGSSATLDPPVSGPPARTSARLPLGAFDPGRRGVKALILLAIVVVVLAAVLAWQARPQPTPAPLSALPPAPSAAESSAGSVLVSIAGRVARPGLVRLPAGARVADAIAAAGGALPGTDLSFVNLARKVNDGELIVIGVTPPPGAAVDPAATGGPVNLNTATLAELDSLPGVGPALAQRIVEYREAHGGFRSVDELRKVEGIGDAKFAELKGRVTV